MTCKDCIKKDVCKHYLYLKENDGLSLASCDYKVLNITSGNKHYESNVALLSSDKEDIILKIQELNNKNISQEELNNDFRVVTNPTELIKCPSCDSENYPDDITSCDICNKSICPCCSTQSYDCNKNEFINICDYCDSTHTDEPTKDNILEWKEYFNADIETDTTHQ